MSDTTIIVLTVGVVTVIYAIAILLLVKHEKNNASIFKGLISQLEDKYLIISTLSKVIEDKEKHLDYFKEITVVLERRLGKKEVYDVIEEVENTILTKDRNRGKDDN